MKEGEGEGGCICTLGVGVREGFSQGVRGEWEWCTRQWEQPVQRPCTSQPSHMVSNLSPIAQVKKLKICPPGGPSEGKTKLL